MAKQSVEVLTSSAVSSSGGGLPWARHHTTTGSDFDNSAGDNRSSTHSTFKSEVSLSQSPIAADPYSSTETRRSPSADLSRSTNSESIRSKVVVPILRPYQLLL